ncbi:RNA polymerase sigma factor [Sphingobacterium paramultivorum]|uniref:RNA polymerase sigma factor n=1 Tax=Sphingobacterium paramultivorum TaxID=2886510 RepID=UPI00129D1122|nr:sigma-70 family RNA polymerase sigma factor [Sphingobacterium paramultivorum]
MFINLYLNLQQAGSFPYLIMSFFRKHINNEEAKYKELFDTYHFRVFMYISKRIKSRENIMDISQNVFVHLWQYRKSLLISNPEAIIFNTCNQEISKFLHAVQKFPTESLMEDLQSKDNAQEPMTTEIEKVQQIDNLYNTINQLPPLRQKILKMNKIDGLTQEQISIELQIPHHTVKYHVSEAMLFLKRNTSFDH